MRQIKFRGKRKSDGMLVANRHYRKTPKGVLTNMYNHMKVRNVVGFTLLEFHEMFLNDPLFIRLYSEWVKGGYRKENKPSIDRINKNVGYFASNIHMLTWRENRFKQTMERRKRKGNVIQYKDGFEICRYRSQRDAVRKTGLRQSLISAVLNGYRTHTGGFQFKYTHDNPELLNEKQ